MTDRAAGPTETMVVVPAFNEGPAIGQVVAELVAHGYPVVVVDDGSSDNTGVAARFAGAIVVRHPINRGQGAGIQTGLTYAVTRSAARYVATFDADGQHRVEDLSALRSALEGGRADVALGSRFLGHAPDIPLGRKALLKLAIAFTTITEGVRLSDAHNGLRMFTRDAAAKLQITRDGMAHASEMVEQIRRLGLRYVEVPVTVRYTEYSRSKGQSSRNALGILAELMVGKLR
jgi:glycosyltransferase involved in cell wall biosynthesis